MRYQNWPARLTAAILAAYTKPFVWGEHDCCLFASSIVFELTGVDHATSFRGKYTTAAGAAKMLRKTGGVRGIATGALGVEISPLLAQRGDVVLVDGDHGDTLAICIGDRCLAPGANGLVSVPMTAAVCAWRVV